MQHVFLLLLAVATLELIGGQHLSSKNNKQFLKRSLKTKSNNVTIDSAVDDITESTAFADRERKLKALMQGEMFPEHNEASKRKEVEKEQTDEDSDDSNEKQEVAGAEKKNRIENHNIEREESISDSLGVEDYDDSNNNADDDENTESGSGSADSSEISADTKSDEPIQSEEEETSTADRRQEKFKCHRKCSMPMTYHECAHPRCSLKVGTIKDLCFYLCKHQKERCEDVCE